MKNCNILFDKKPAYASTTDSFLQDTRFLNWNRLLTTGVSFIVYFWIYQNWKQGRREKALYITLIYAAIYIFLQSKIASIKSRYDFKCVVPKDNIYLQ